MAEIRRIRIKPPSEKAAEVNRLVTPGDTITSDSDYMRGHGTYFEDTKLLASVAGVVETVNKLIHVNPLKTRYNGEVVMSSSVESWSADVVICESTRRELRRRSAKDELNMRKYLQEGDLVSAEVQSVYGDGSLSLHTRNLKYGKLGQGMLVKVSPMVVKRSKTHMQTSLRCQHHPRQQRIHLDQSHREPAGRHPQRWFHPEFGECDAFDTCILYTYESSMRYTITELLVPEKMENVVEWTLQRLEQEGAV
ncbi:putative exosome complex component RRP4-like [Apostichopus japonicus]|uniref:Putative exosome complex component RRP4-like n=1 Tax=Stichopus japonicus TaxID=307972 RepID=A0A2G8LER5_STIJA|nr:putative exosome complex component RRP4-like [Apostichopus japonicus]